MVVSTTATTGQKVSIYQDNFQFVKSPGSSFKIPLWRSGSKGELWANVWLKPGWQEPSAEGYTNQMQTVYWADGEEGIKNAEFIQQPTGNPIEYITAYIGREDIWAGQGETEIYGVLESLIAIHDPNIEPHFIERQKATLIRGLSVTEDADPVSVDFTLLQLAQLLPRKTPYQELIIADGKTTEWLINFRTGTSPEDLSMPHVEFWYEQLPIDLYWEPGGDGAIIFRPTLGLAQGVEVLVKIW